MNAFERALKAANDQSVKEAAKGLFDLYRALQEAGFNKAEAMLLMTSMIRNGKGGER